MSRDACIHQLEEETAFATMHQHSELIRETQSSIDFMTQNKEQMMLSIDEMHRTRDSHDLKLEQIRCYGNTLNLAMTELRSGMHMRQRSAEFQIKIEVVLISSTNSSIGLKTRSPSLCMHSHAFCTTAGRNEHHVDSMPSKKNKDQQCVHLDSIHTVQPASKSGIDDYTSVGHRNYWSVEDRTCHHGDWNHCLRVRRWKMY